MIKTFRGVLADGGQDRIRLQTIKGKTGYRIVKLDIFPKNPGHTADKELLVQVWNTEVATVAAGSGTVVNFTDSDLLGVAYFTENSSGAVVTGPAVVIFDQEVFNQDIYITNQDQSTGESANYYLELEVIPLNDAGAEYTTLKDMRQG